MHPGIQSWKNLVIYAFNAFSIPLLLKTLFSPWENDNTDGTKLGLLEKIVFAIFSRILGFIARVIYIFFGLVFTILTTATFPIFLIFPIKIEKEFLQNLGSFGAHLSYGNTFTLNSHSKNTNVPTSLKIYGKEKVLRMIERGLSIDSNHNILLVGENGVGKSTIISHLKRLGKSGLSFPGIRNHRIVELSVEGISLNDFDKAMNEASKAGNIIVVLKNIYKYQSLYELSLIHI